VAQYIQGARLPIATKPEPFGLDEPLPSLSDNAAAILDMAEELARGGQTPEVVAARHLIGAMISAKVGKDPFARRHLEEVGLDLTALRTRFFGLVSSTSPDDDLALWQAQLDVRDVGVDEGKTHSTSDPLLERLLLRRLAVSTLASDKLEHAQELLDGELLSKVGDGGFRRRVRLAFLRP
jgi:hypothetical protein